MHFDINNPKFRYAQHLANSMQMDQVIVKNMFGDYDVKRASSVIIINNPDLVCIVEPTNRRQKNGELEFDCVLN